MRRHLSTIRPANQWTYPYCLGRVFLSFEAEATTLHHQPRRNVSNKRFRMHTTSKQAMPFLHRLFQPQQFTETLSYTMRVSIDNKGSVQSLMQQGNGSSPTAKRVRSQNPSSMSAKADLLPSSHSRQQTQMYVRYRGSKG